MVEAASVVTQLHQHAAYRVAYSSRPVNLDVVTRIGNDLTQSTRRKCGGAVVSRFPSSFHGCDGRERYARCALLVPAREDNQRLVIE
jgi:hypothetical protein